MGVFPLDFHRTKVSAKQNKYWLILMSAFQNIPDVPIHRYHMT